MRHLTPLVLLSLVGCMAPKDKARMAAMELEIQALSERVDAMESKAPSRAMPPAGPTPVEETEAADLLKEANAAYEAGDLPKTKELLEELSENYGSTRAGRASQRLQSEIAVLGKTVSPLNAERWFKGEADITDGVVLVVAFEVWCPHCRREMPVMNEKYERLQSLGVREVVGLTRITKSATEGQVEEWVAEQGINFPIAKEDGNTATELGIRGIPASAILRDGEVIWRGHPARLSDELIVSLLEG